MLADSLAHAVAHVSPRDYLAEARASYDAVSRAYNGTRVVLRLLGPVYGILCGLLLLFTGVSARYRDIAENLGHRRYVRVLVYFTLYSTTLFLIGLPLAWYEEFALEHQYGLSTQTLSGWWLDSLKGQATTVASVGVIPLLALAWRVVEAQPRRWWLWIAAGTLPVAIAAVLLEPIVFDPLFNKFTPLEDVALRHDILALAARAGIPARHVFQVDMSTRTRKLNAYVSGFGASQRVVIWDTTLQRMRRDEILYVTGHEMGHYVLHHIWKTLLALGIGAFAVFWLAAQLTNGWLRAFGGRWGIRAPADLAAMPVFAISLTIASLVATPAMNALSRREEHDADVYGLEITRDNDAAARAFLKLAQDNRSDPEPPQWIRLLLFDHPPLADRIRLAITYHPWTKGEPNRFYRPR
ncbi:MAG TPA: M48 family metallopeptidase [Candidatus Acidoferrales bacterium]|nr:M48 family metallopeptidase [Candidatus Acidoferrales bacterium]